ncbi:TOPRS ligase, partial [Illadopsis cleaveri]|nr:TOPRS ligase [Illadopsis cleaveri]
MATETEWNCPICRDIPGEIASVTPCVHLFCLGCIVRWAKRRPSCPLCRQAINSIIYSVRSDEDFLEMVLPGPSDSSAAGQQDEQAAAEPMPRTYVAGYPPELWAGFFQDCPEILEPLLPWLNQELSELLRTHWWEVALAQSTVVANLCRYGLSEEALVRELHPTLQEQTAPFVRRLIDIAADRCSDEILRQMNLLNAQAEEKQEQEEEQAEQEQEQQEQEEQEEQDGPTAIPGPSASRQGTPSPIVASSCSPVVSNVEADVGTSAAALRGGPGRSPSAPVPAEREQRQEQPGRAAAGAGPSARGCSRSPPAPGRDTDCLPEGPRRPAKRRASGPQDSPQPPKRPSRQRQ